MVRASLNAVVKLNAKQRNVNVLKKVENAIVDVIKIGHALIMTKFNVRYEIYCYIFQTLYCIIGSARIPSMHSVQRHTHDIPMTDLL